MSLWYRTVIALLFETNLTASLCLLLAHKNVDTFLRASGRCIDCETKAASTPYSTLKVTFIHEMHLHSANLKAQLSFRMLHQDTTGITDIVMHSLQLSF